MIRLNRPLRANCGAKRRTEFALQLADDRFWKAHQLVDDYFTTISEEWLIDEPGMQPLRRQLLEKAQEYLLEFTRLRRGDPRFRRELALAHYRLGLIIGQIGSARESLEQFSAAEQIWQQFVDLPGSPRTDRIELANTYLQMGRAHRKLAQGPGACRRPGVGGPGGRGTSH